MCDSDICFDGEGELTSNELMPIISRTINAQVNLKSTIKEATNTLSITKSKALSEVGPDFDIEATNIDAAAIVCDLAKDEAAMIAAIAMLKSADCEAMANQLEALFSFGTQMNANTNAFFDDGDMSKANNSLITESAKTEITEKIMVVVCVETDKDEDHLHEDDRHDIPGKYAILIDPSAPSDKWADIALDVFHNEVAISVLEDFSISVTYNSKEIYGNPDHKNYSCLHLGMRL